MWLKVAPSNHNPKVIARYYLESVEGLAGMFLSISSFINISYFDLACPTILRSDYGTENSCLAAIHIAFRFYHSDELAGEKSFLYGPSKHNIVSLKQQ